MQTKKIKTIKKLEAVLKPSSPVMPNVENIKQQLTAWAHEGTQKSIEKILEFIKNEKDKDILGFADCAYHEAAFFYYSPQTDQEEKDFLTAKMIADRDWRVYELSEKADAARLELKRLAIDKEVDKRVVKKYKGDKEDWEYSRFSDDYMMMIKDKLQGFEEEIEYEMRWIDEANKMIKNEKYRNIPFNVLKNIHLDNEGSSIWDDDDDENATDEETICEENEDIF